MRVNALLAVDQTPNEANLEDLLVSDGLLMALRAGRRIFGGPRLLAFLRCRNALPAP